jgi:hypothetical protein
MPKYIPINIIKVVEFLFKDENPTRKISLAISVLFKVKNWGHPSK